MAGPRPLAEDEIVRLLTVHPRWRRRGDALVATFDFADFADAFAWMTAVALVSERLDHHPDWSNVWNRVEVTLTTHSAGGITTADREWIDRVEALDRTPPARRS